MVEENYINKVINERYELIEVVGSGGMATVYKAYDKLLNRYVAVKILKESLKNDGEIVSKFGEEAKAAASLTHNNIVSVYDVGTINGLGFIVMEYVEGQTLKEFIYNNGIINWQKACDIAIQIAGALSVAHENGIIHRDIKPHNIIITGDGVAKVADFGIASAAGSDTVVAGGSAMGSVLYISPEQARGGFVDKTSDIYSLGVVLYEMLTHTLPFEGTNAVNIALKKLEEEPLNPKIINLDIPYELDAIVMKAIAREQHIRYKTADEFANDLKELLVADSKRTVPTKRTSVAAETEKVKPQKKNKKRNGSSLTASLVAAGLILLGVIVAAVFLGLKSGDKEYEVPQLVGLTLQEAEAIVQREGFEINGITYEASDEIETDVIISQNPEGKLMVKANRTIEVVVSKGSQNGNIAVPNVKGFTLEKAKEAIEKIGLICRINEVYDEDSTDDKVLKQAPAAGEMLSAGNSVTVWIKTNIEKNEDDQEKADDEDEDKHKDKDKDKDEKNEEKETPKPSSTPTPTPSATPSQNTNSTPAQATPAPTPQMKKKVLTISIPDTANDTIQLRVEANGHEIHNQTHSKSEGKVDLTVQSVADAEVKVYIDNELVATKIIDFDS